MNDSHSTEIHRAALGMGLGSEHGEVLQRDLIVLCGDIVWSGNGIMDSPPLKKLLVWEGRRQEGTLEYSFHKYSALKKCKSTGTFFCLYSGVGLESF